MRKIIILLIYTSFAFLSLKGQDIVLTQNLGHHKAISQILISPDGNYLLSGDQDGVIKLWDKHLSKEIRTFTESYARIYDLVFAPDGKSFFSSSEGNIISQWDIETGKKIGLFEGSKKPVFSLSISSNNKTLIAGNENGEVLLFDIAEKKLLKTIPRVTKYKERMSFVFDPSRDFAISYAANSVLEDDWEVKVWNYSTGNILYELNGGDYVFYRIILSSNGKYVIAAGKKKDDYWAKDNIIKVFNAQNGGLISSVKTGKVTFLDYDPRSDMLIYGEYKEIHTVNIKNGEKINNFEYNADANTIDSNEGKIIVADYYHLFSVDINKGSISNTYYKYSDAVRVTKLSSNSDFLALGTDIGIKFFDMQKGKFISMIDFKFDDLLDLWISPDDRTIAALYSQSVVKDSLTVSLFDISTGKKFNENNFSGKAASCFSVSSDLKQVALGSGDWETGKVEVYNLSKGLKLHTFSDIKFNVNKVSFINNDASIMTSCNGAVQIFNALTGTLEKSYKPHSKKGNFHEILKGSNYALSAGGDAENGAIVLWDYTTGKVMQNKYQGVDQAVMHCVLSPDKSLVVASLGFWIGRFINHKETEVKVWDAKTGTLKATLPGEHNSKGVFFSTSSDRIYTVTESGQISIWDAKSLNKIGTIYSIWGKSWVVSTPNGYFDGNQEGVSRLHFVRGMNIIPLESFYEQYYSPNILAQVLSGERTINSEVSISNLSLPPKVQIITPENRVTLTNESVTVTVMVTDQGGGVDEIRLYHNGKMLEGTPRGFKVTGMNKEFTISLIPGENHIKVTAFNSQRTESIPDEIVLTYKAPQQVKPNMYILAIGINSYLNPKYSLNFAKNDAEAFVQSLKTGATPIFGNVNVTSISDVNATKEVILSAIDKIKSQSKPEDVFVFYYAGHGVMSTGSEDEKSMFFLVPYDVTKMYEADDMLKRLGISANEIGEFSKNIKAQKQLFVIDACQSGGAMQTLAMRGAAEEKAIAQLARSTGTYFIAASGSEQFATEVKELGHGVFTYSVIEALRGSCKSKDGKVTVNLLKGCVEDLVPELSKKYKGQPQFPTGYGFGQDFPIVIVK